MIKEEKISVSISYRNITHYIKLGYNPIIGEDLIILADHLPSGSHVKITAICNICSGELNMMYCKYLENKNRHGFYGCKKCSKQKAAITSIYRYGVDNYSKTAEYKNRVVKTNIEKYGYKTNLISPIFKDNIKSILKDKYGTENFYEINRNKLSPKNKFKLKSGIYQLISDFNKSEDFYDNSLLNSRYLLYRNEVRRITKRSIKEFNKNWDGYDHYDGELILDNFSLNHNDKLSNYRP